MTFEATCMFFLFFQIAIAIHKCEAFVLRPHSSQYQQYERMYSQGLMKRPSKQQLCCRTSQNGFALQATSDPNQPTTTPSAHDHGNDKTNHDIALKLMEKLHTNRDLHQHDNNNINNKEHNKEKMGGRIGQVAITATVIAGIGLLLESLWHSGGGDSYRLNNIFPWSAPREAAATAHVLAYGIWLGSLFYTEFVSGLTMYQILPLQTFGMIQANLFPKYFFLSTVLLMVQLVTLLLFGPVSGGGGILPAALSSKATLTLSVALLLTLSNLLYLEPVTTKVMMEMFEEQNKAPKDVPAEEPTRIKTLSQRFGLYHTLSNGVDLICLCAAVLHGSYLAAAILGT